MKRFLVFFALAALGACTRGGEPPVLSVPPLAPEDQAPESLLSVDLLPGAVSPGVVEMVEPLPPPPLSLQPSISISPAGATRLKDVNSVLVKVELKGSAGPHEVIAEFGAPGTIPYERRVKAIAGSAFDVQTVEFVLPVAGTMIDQQNLSGTWTVALFHDGQKLSAPTFELSP